MGKQSISTFLAVKEIHFYTDNAKIPLKLTESTLVFEGNRLSEVKICLEVSFAQYEQIDQQHLFHLEDDKKDISEAYHFDPLRNITIELILDRAVFSQVNSIKAQDFIQLLSQLDNANAPADLLAAQNWYVLTVKQEVTLPAEMATKGSLAMGYATVWYAEKFAEKMPESVLFSRISTFFRAVYPDLTVVEPSRQFKFLHQDPSGHTWECSLVLREQQQQVMFYADFPYPVKEKNIALRKINEINYDLPIGNFEMHPDEGTVRFKTYVDFSRIELHAALVQAIYDASIYNMNKYWSAIEALAQTKFAL
jgi:hypothetical protein